MPYKKVEGHAECDGGEVAVVKEDDGSLLGCHDSEQAADDQIAALYANEPSEVDAEHFGTSQSVSSKPWDGAPSRFNDQQYRNSAAACDGDGSTKQSCFLPHHEPGGALSRAAVHAAASRVSTLKGRSPEAVARAKAHLRSHYGQLDEEPPDSLKAEVESEDTEVFGKPNPGTPPDRRLKENKRKKKATTAAEGETETFATEQEQAMTEPEGETLARKGPPVVKPDEDGNCPDGMRDVGGRCVPTSPNAEADTETLATEEAANTGETATWEGVLTVEGVETGDGREFAPGALSWGDPPLPFMWQKETSHGGNTDKSVRVGSVLQIWRENDGRVMGRGVFDLGGPDDDDAHEAWRRMRDGFLNGNSVDVDSVKDADVEFVWPEGKGPAAGSDDVGLVFEMPEKRIFHAGRIRGTTLVEFPAFVEAWLNLTGGVAPVLAAQAQVVEPEPDREALVAHAASEDWRPPVEWFTDPGLNVPIPVTVTDQGRVYGHAAQWGECHLGFGDTCIKPPQEDAHPYFLTGEVVCDDGSRVAVGQVVAGIGHAPLYLGASKAHDHYDNTLAVVADVTVGNDKHGIWVAGAIRPSAESWRVHELRASGQVSPDWHRIGGQLRMVGLLTVNISGYQVPRARARALVASGEVRSLIATGWTVTNGNAVASAHYRHALRAAADEIMRRAGLSSRPEGSD